ncbi:MAG: hypothetical protein WBG94_08720 [Anaerolineales bacterium]
MAIESCLPAATTGPAAYLVGADDACALRAALVAVGVEEDKSQNLLRDAKQGDQIWTFWNSVSSC